MVEKQVKLEMDNNRLTFSEGTRVVENLFKHNIGSTEFQSQIEKYLADKIEHERIPELLNIARAIYDPKYIIKYEKLNEDLCTALTLAMEDLSIRQLELLFWSVTRDKKIYNRIMAENKYSKMLIRSLMNNMYRR